MATTITNPNASTETQPASASTTEYAISIINLNKSYGAIHAVKDLNLSIRPREIFALLGPNGAGKSTTIEILEGYRKRDSGSVSVLGLDPGNPAGLSGIKQRMGVMLQQSTIYEYIRVGEAVSLFASYYARPANPRELIALVGLEEHANQIFKELSGGQKQRLALALTLVGNPDIVFLDEPTGAMDPQARRATWDIITGLRDRGVTVLLTTHYMEEAQRLADRVAIIDHGSLLALDTPNALQQHLGGDAVQFHAAPGLPIDALGALSGASSAKETTPGEYAIAASDPDRLIMSLMLWANSQSIQPTNVKIERASLEDVFLQLTGDEVRD